jgi:enoyl-CoA hydratase/carnithine racemase
MTDTKITTEQRGHLLLIGINRPAKLNAFDVEMLHQLGDAFGALESDDGLRCGVVFAHGENFTAGLDLGNVAPAIMQGELVMGAGRIDPWGVHGKARTKPTVIAVHGRCLTLGIELILAQDVCVAASDTRCPDRVKRGIFPFGGATFRLVHTAGWGNAMRWLLTGDGSAPMKPIASAWSKRWSTQASKSSAPSRSPRPLPRRHHWVCGRRLPAPAVRWSKKVPPMLCWRSCAA